MDRAKFWKLIQHAKKESAGDIDEQVAILEEDLAIMPPLEIRSFDLILQQLMRESFRADLWGAASLINHTTADDSFESFRGWLIAQGENTFKRAIENPDNLFRYIGPDGDPCECDQILCVARDAYEDRTDQPEYDDVQEELGPPELHGDPTLWSDGKGHEDEEKLRALFPRLAKKCLDQ